MSEIKLNLLDSHTLLTATIHGSVGDALVAALSAEPETIDELETALKRFNKSESIPASYLRRQPRGPIDDQAWDAGILVIDLPARMVAFESTYSLPTRAGRVYYHDGTHSTGFPLGYLLSDDWLFRRSIVNYKARCDQLIKERAATPPFDTRSILYGEPLHKFIVENVQLLDTTTKRRRKKHRASVVDIHRRWLMTPRDDLNGQTVREVLFGKRDLIDFDLQSRMLQWSYFLEEPTSLSKESHAYRFAGYGTHEWVMYYNLVRFLIWEAVDLKKELESHATHLLSTHCCRPKSVIAPRNPPNSAHALTFNPCPVEKRETASPPETSDAESDDWRYGTRRSAFAFYNMSDQKRHSEQETSPDQKICRSPNTQPTNLELIAYLAMQQAQWLSTPNQQLDGYIPAGVIDNERRRRPEAMTGRSMVVDEDCYCCKMMGDESEAGLGIYFCHFDGCNMEDEFAFSSCATLEEWKAEQRRYQEWNRKSERERQGASTSVVDLDDCEIPF
jgi:hypothetical protein